MARVGRSCSAIPLTGAGASWAVPSAEACGAAATIPIPASRPAASIAPGSLVKNM
ncbi:hypothetical protein G7085_07750 [Tessaracoccus sp. HDW20]|uniref:hypothetical protein n=1 Tax=Tessaracoccus coleopterorum TaxID=2714950 RepID=UPI0018D2EB01|nr:hypothetical protein [Tessaracoccus coleopterorum]NHB84537.1 hypothetical protein [Tessaracoccus coleopterorum]